MFFSSSTHLLSQSLSAAHLNIIERQSPLYRIANNPGRPRLAPTSQNNIRSLVHTLVVRPHNLGTLYDMTNYKDWKKVYINAQASPVLQCCAITSRKYLIGTFSIGNEPCVKCAVKPIEHAATIPVALKLSAAGGSFFSGWGTAKWATQKEKNKQQKTNEPGHSNPYKLHKRPAKTQISPRIRAVCSESSHRTLWVTKHEASSDRQRILIGLLGCAGWSVFTGRTKPCLKMLCPGAYVIHWRSLYFIWTGCKKIWNQHTSR